jgi:hypothetical protein
VGDTSDFDRSSIFNKNKNTCRIHIEEGLREMEVGKSRLEENFFQGAARQGRKEQI